MAKSLFKASIPRWDNIVVAILFGVFFSLLLLFEDAMAFNRYSADTSNLATKEAVNIKSGRVWITKPLSKRTQQGNFTIDIYKWESLLRTYEFHLITDPQGDRVWGLPQIPDEVFSIKVKWKSVAYIITPFLFFFGYILFRK